MRSFKDSQVNPLQLDADFTNQQIQSILRDPSSGHHDHSRPPDMDGHTCTGARIKIRLRGVPRRARGTEKVNGEKRQSKEMNSESAQEEVS
jgi:hypothetical protein